MKALDALIAGGHFADNGSAEDIYRGATAIQEPVNSQNQADALQWQSVHGLHGITE